MSYKDDEEFSGAEIDVDMDVEEEEVDDLLADDALDDPLLEDELLVEDDLLAEDEEDLVDFAGIDGSEY
jgi:hypothetical protein